MINTIEIKTRTPPDLPSLKQRLKDFFNYLMQFEFEELRKCHLAFFGAGTNKHNKRELVTVLTAVMTFDNEKAFREWFFKFPAAAQCVLYRLAFDCYVPVKSLEKSIGLPLCHLVPGNSWQKGWAFDAESGLQFLEIFTRCNGPFVILPKALRKILTEWLVPPPELSLENCTADPGAYSGPAWENSAGIAVSLPLLYDALTDLFKTMKPPDSPYRCIRGFKKKNVEELRKSSGFKPFDIPGGEAKASDLVPDSVDLTARFILGMANFSILRPKDGQNAVKALVTSFFGEESLYKDYVNPPDRHSLEYNVLFEHISKASDYSLNYRGDLPASRRLFLHILMYCARDGRIFDADKIAGLIYRTLQDFSFYFNDIARDLKYKADTIVIDGESYTDPYNNVFYPDSVLKYYLLTAPLFKAYCYLFAALGLLEITQTAPPLMRIQNEKKRPLSPYDSLKTFQITEFGKWCLGLTKTRPEVPDTEYQAIADKELLLVTVQGNSLERSVYLDRIGRRLASRADSGTDRWRISPDSFIEGCGDKSQIEERIAKFKALIDPEPAPHWIGLFDKVINRAGLFDINLSSMLVYRLPVDRNLAEELLEDAEFRSLVHRAEGGLIVVPEKKRKKFYEALKKHGIAAFENG
jgi:hypothetical protein